MSWFFWCWMALHAIPTTWEIGAKIHLEEKNGADYIGLFEINSVVKQALQNDFQIAQDLCEGNAKILLEKKQEQLIINHYTEKMNPTVGEEMHCTLLYTKERGFCQSETLKQVCKTLFADCKESPTIESVSTRYQEIINASWKFKVSEIKAYHNKNSITFSARLTFADKDNIYFKEFPVSAGLHLTLIQCFEPSIFTDKTIQSILKSLNQKLQGKFIKIALRNAMADLEFGISGQAWRIRAGEKIELGKNNNSDR